MKKGDLVAVYGTLREGFYNHRLLESAIYMGETIVKGFVMFSINGWYPGINEGNGNIVVEIYEITDDDMANNLDRLEGYPSMYNRKQIETEYGKVWIYIFNRKHEEYQRVAGGDWREFTTAREPENIY